MHLNDYTMAWENFEYGSHMKRVRGGDRILVYAAKLGFVGVGEALGVVETFPAKHPNRLVKGFSGTEWRIPVRWLAWDSENAFRYQNWPDGMKPQHATVTFKELTSDWAGVIAKTLIHFGIGGRRLAASSLNLAKQLRFGYGRDGGEGPQHRALKIHVWKHPETIGLSEVVASECEYLLPSCDEVDVHFELRSKPKWHVVEVKVDYAEEMIRGVFQAIKYRALKAAELGLKLGDTDVQAHLVVASKPPVVVQELAKKYQVELHVVKLQRDEEE